MIYFTYAILVLAWLFIIFGMIAIFSLKNMYTRHRREFFGADRTHVRFDRFRFHSPSFDPDSLFVDYQSDQFTRQYPFRLLNRHTAIEQGGSNMSDLIPFILQILLILVALAIVLHEKNFTIIILFSTFSLIAATLYAINKAPDVAIAEVAIGSAIIPLIYVISISRQREFIVLDRSLHGFIDPNQSLVGDVYDVLNDFVLTYDLRLNVCCDIEGDESTLTSQLNVDLIITHDIENDRYILKGKHSSVLLTKLEKLVKDNEQIVVIALKEGDSLD